MLFPSYVAIMAMIWFFFRVLSTGDALRAEVFEEALSDMSSYCSTKEVRRARVERSHTNDSLEKLMPGKFDAMKSIGSKFPLMGDHLKGGRWKDDLDRTTAESYTTIKDTHRNQSRAVAVYTELACDEPPQPDMTTDFVVHGSQGAWKEFGNGS
jgi:hypothetical protein